MIQIISATEARNNFFSIIDQSFLEKKRFLVKKGNIPIAYIGPPTEITTISDDIFDEIAELKKGMKKGGDSVKLIRQMRNER